MTTAHTSTRRIAAASVGAATALALVAGTGGAMAHDVYLPPIPGEDNGIFVSVSDHGNGVATLTIFNANQYGVGCIAVVTDSFYYEGPVEAHATVTRTATLPNGPYTLSANCGQGGSTKYYDASRQFTIGPTQAIMPPPKYHLPYDPLAPHTPAPATPVSPHGSVPNPPTRPTPQHQAGAEAN